MSTDEVITLCRDMLYTALVLVSPILAIGLAVGLFAAIIQAITSIQEQTLSMIPKMLVIAVTLMILAPWMITRLMSFASNTLSKIGA